MFIELFKAYLQSESRLHISEFSGYHCLSTLCSLVQDVLTIVSLYMKEVKLVVIDIAFNVISACTPFIFWKHSL